MATKFKQEKGSIRFFKMNKCGFYKQKRINNKTYKVHCGEGLSSISKVVMDWVLAQSNIEETIPWDVEASQKRTKIYCRCVSNNEVTGDYLFVFWKAINNGESRLGGISKSAKVGDDGVSDIKIDTTDIIVGQPMYYWVVPEYDIMASVNFSHSLSDLENVSLYFKRCIDNKIDFPHKTVSVKEHPAFDVNIVDVSYKDPKDNGVMKFIFDASKDEMNITEIDPNLLASKITHIVTRDVSSEIARVSGPERGGFKIFNKIREVKSVDKIEIIESVDLSVDELKQIFNIYKDEKIATGDDDWTNIGFKELGSDQTRWIDTYVTQSVIPFPPLRANCAFHSSSSVLQTLTNHRAGLLSFASKLTEDEFLSLSNEDIESKKAV